MTLTQDQKIQSIQALTPEGQSPKLYAELVKTQVLGVDKNGQNRPDEDLFYFLYTAHRTGLDPILKQIYAVYRWDSRLGREKMAIQVGIDGMRLVAQRSGNFAGISDAVYDNEDQPTPKKATVTVKKTINGLVVETTASARWEEYSQESPLWKKMPYLMLAKCAEALALRKAFPNELSGIYTEDEMPNKGLDLPKPEKIEKEDLLKVHFPTIKEDLEKIDIKKMREESK